MSIADYFRLKSINLCTAIEQVYGLRVDDELDKSLEAARHAFSEWVEFDLDEILTLSPEEFIQKIKSRRYQLSFIDLIAQLTFQLVELFRQSTDLNKVANLEVKYLYLLRLMASTDKTYSIERNSQMEQLETKYNLHR
jgi:hypothetical protein